MNLSPDIQRGSRLRTIEERDIYFNNIHLSHPRQHIAMNQNEE